MTWPSPWSNQILNTLIVGGTGGGLFVYNGTPGPGNPPIFYASAQTTDPYGNAIVPTVGLTGIGQFNAGNTIINIHGIFVYSGTPATGNLIASIASAAGTDTFGNIYPQGIYSQQLTLQNQSSAPPALGNASVFYSSTLGRPRYLSSAGVDAILERSVVNVSQFTVGNTTTPSQISAALNYQVNEGNQSSEFQIEIDGVMTTATVGPQTLTFGLAVDGTTLGGQVTIGASFLVINKSWEYTARFRLAILTNGAGGTCVISCDGQITQQGSNSGNTGINTPFGATSGTTGKAFDTTSAHTITIVASWGATSTGQTLTTVRSLIKRAD